jgi:hypothetical protein
MFKVKGVYNGTSIDLLEPISIPVNTEVEVMIEGPKPSISDSQEAEQAFLEHLLEIGLISHIASGEIDPTPFEPIVISGKPLSETIIEERR